MFTPRCCILEDFLQPIASPVQSVDKITQTNFISVLEYQLISLQKECTFATWLNSSSRFFLLRLELKFSCKVFTQGLLDPFKLTELK